MMRKFRLTIAALLIILVSILALAITLGGPVKPAPMQSIGDPFKAVDYSDLPSVKQFSARDGSQLAYRAYASSNAGDSKGSVIIVHGSSGSSSSVHPLAKGFAQAGYAVYALDMRGHGESGEKGQIAYIGQLEDDVEDFMKAARPLGKKSLVGFSSGGGFTLRFAADMRRSVFDNYLLMSPFLGPDASTYRSGGGGWVSVGVPRIVGLILLNRIGITHFNYLPVTAFAINEDAVTRLTPSYSFALAANFGPHRKYRDDIIAASSPMEVMVGQNDELFISENFSSEFKSAVKLVPITIVPATGHINLTLSPIAIRTAVEAINRLDGGT